MGGAANGVLDYYAETRWDYRALWFGPADMAIHFGYYDDEADSHCSAVLRMNAALAELSGIRSQDHVLDAGCGYGGSATWLAQNRGCTVDGVTLVPFQAVEGSKRVSEMKLSHQVKLLLGDYHNLPFAEGSHTVYWALESLVHAQNRSKALAEAHRVLQPRGRLVIAEYLLRDTPPLTDATCHYLQPWLDAWSMPRLLTASEYRDLLQKSGFSDIEIRDVSPQVSPSLKRLKRLCQVALPGARLARSAGLFSQRRLDNIIGSLRQANALEQGLWCYSLIRATRN